MASGGARDVVWGESLLTLALQPAFTDASCETVAIATVKCGAGVSESERTNTAEWLQFGALLQSALRAPARRCVSRRRSRRPCPPALHPSRRRRARRCCAT